MQIVAAVKQSLECPICIQYMKQTRDVSLLVTTSSTRILKEQRSTSCGHMFCELCLTRASESQRAQALESEDDDVVEQALNFYVCPICRTYTDRNISPTVIHSFDDVLALLPSE